MLKQRLLTILVALPLFLAALIYLAPWSFMLFSAVLVMLAAWEWGGLGPLHSWIKRSAFVAGVLLCLWLSWLVPLQTWLWMDLGIWVWASVALFHYGRGGSGCGVQYRGLRLGLAFVMLTPFWIAINVLRDPNFWQGLLPETFPLYGLLVWVLALVWSVDTGAYIAGRTCGRHLLLPRVSPKKTWEGLVGGIVLCAAVAVGTSWMLHLPSKSTYAMLIVAVVVAYFSVIGDLFESMLKRQAQVKDSSGLLPGHGGILDRFDSVIAALPMVVLVLLLLRQASWL